MMPFYRLLLYLLPASFRGEYSTEMCALFAKRKRETSGASGSVLLWAETISDLILTALAAHWDILLQDLKYTARTVRRSPGFAVTVIAVMALGVGATTAAFSLADHVLIRPLPFRDADRLVTLWEDQRPQSYSEEEPSPANYRDWKRMSHSFEQMASWRGFEGNLTGNGEPENVKGKAVEADMFPMLGVGPAIGRIFTKDDDRSGALGTLVLSDSFWRAKFGGAPSAIGRKVLLDGAPYSVIGVMPPNFYFPSRDTQFWVAMRFENHDFVDRTNNYLRVVAKLKPGGTKEEAMSEMRVIAEQLRREYPKDNAHVSVTVGTLRDHGSKRSRVMLLALLGAALCVLLIACVNVANLLIARGLERSKEIAVRTAMGAGRERLVRQLLTESLLLSLAGGVCGVLLGIAVLPVLARLVPNSMPIAEMPSVDLRVLGFAALVTITTGLLFGIVPAARAFSTNVHGLGDGARSGVGGRKERLRSILVISEVTASVVLLVSSGLLIRALWQLQKEDPGFHASGVLTLRTALPMPAYEKTARCVAFYRRVMSGIQALPGVTAVGYTSFLPMTLVGGVWPVSVAGQPKEDASFHMVSMRFITPGFLQAMGIPLLRGRNVSEADTLQSQLAAVVSESLVRRYWPNQDPIGRRIQFVGAERTIVGVTGNIRWRGLEAQNEPQIYLPYKQLADNSYTWYSPKDLVVRSSVPPGSLLPAIRKIVASADPQQPISDVKTMTDVMDAETAPRILQLQVLGCFAALAILLAGIGIHGLLSFAVSSRTPEIGVRIAMGARPSQILTMILRQGLGLAAAGISIGVCLAYVSGRAMEAMLVGVKPTDLLSFVVAAALTVAMALAGSLFPSIRAVRIDPIAAIRAE